MSLLAEYRASLKNAVIEEYVDLVFFRLLAFLFVKSTYRTNITPNQITVLAMLTGILGGVMFAPGGSAFVIGGGLLLALATIFDCADGQLARLKNNGTSFGRILDGVVDYIYTVAAFLGIGLGGSNGSMGPFLWWTFVTLAGASYAVQAGLLDYYRNEFLAHAKGADGFVENELSIVKAERQKYSTLKGHFAKRLMLDVYIRYSLFQKRLNAAPRSI